MLTILIVGVSRSARFTQLGQHRALVARHGRLERRCRCPSSSCKGQTALERQGALVFQAKQCRNCHALGDEGGRRGPALDDVATRLTQDQLIRQVLQGGGNMPAYGKNLSPAETTALVAFLETLHPPHIAPARDSRGAGRAGGHPRSSAP